MFSSTSRFTGVLVSVLALSASAPLSVAHANGTIDNIITGSISPNASIPAPSHGSAAFRNALSVLQGGDAAGAYQLAKSLPSDIERRAIQWAAIYFGNGTVDYDSVSRFAKDAPGFASPGLYKTRLEQSLTKSNPSGAELISRLAGHIPNTLKAQIMLAIAFDQDGQHARAARLARDIWVGSYLGADSEKQILSKLGNLLGRADHWQRAQFLLMHERATQTEPLLSLLSPAERSLAVGVIAVEKRASNAKALLARVDPSFRQHPLFYFAHAQLEEQAGNLTGAVNYLDNAKGDLPEPSQWWYERRGIVREALAAGNPKLAYRAAAEYTSGPEGRMVEAHFHAGWIATSFLNDQASAKRHFEAMAKLSTIPSSITQSQYWLGRTLTKLGDKAGAKAAYEKAARYGTIYYGMLARNALGLKSVELRALPGADGSQAAFDAHDAIRAVKLLADNGAEKLAAPLLRHFASSLKDSGQLLLAARLAQTINAQDLTVEIADMADRRGTALDLFSFPKDPLPPTMKLADIDKAAVYAVARQESKFKINAVSSSGALGLMQLMPATAKETAKKVGVSYSPKRLTSDSAYNALLGSTYLANQLQRFNGSLLLAAAAYNAGASNAAKWIAAYGDPRQPNVDREVWVELIPFKQTRDYVQRVIGNYVVYRARMGDSSMSVDEALRKISG